MSNKVWCRYHHDRADRCPPTEDGCGRELVMSELGRNDEPQQNGALVVVWPGDYRMQEVWVASGANIGNWYCLGNEFRKPKVWEDPRSADAVWDLRRLPASERPHGTIPLHPTFEDVLDRGPVSLLTVGGGQAYTRGWANGRRDLLHEIESLADDGPPDTGGF